MSLIIGEGEKVSTSGVRMGEKCYTGLLNSEENEISLLNLYPI